MVSDIRKPKKSSVSGKSENEELDRLRELAARAQADLQNAKARLEKEGEDIRKFAGEACVRRLLPIVDHFQRAMAYLPADLASHEWVKGITAIAQDLWKQMEEMGLRKMQCMGLPVDPLKHEVLLTAPGEQGKVLEVLEDGYEFQGRVLRPAKVKMGESAS